MKIAFLHYHLKPGGVTRVIRQQIAALSRQAEILLLTGAAPQAPMSVETKVIPDIGYDIPDKAPENSAKIPQLAADQIIKAIYEKWPNGCDILHVHNPLLTKNQQFLKVLSQLQLHGIRLLLQVHDFAEDGRPGAYYAAEAYPKNCHYCVINSRDRNLLLRAGLIKNGLHLLPNMVEPFNLTPEKSINHRFVLYPVRAIRRKNIGEAILLSCFFNPDTRLAITLPPNSPRDRAPYNSWRAFAKNNRLPVIFEASGEYEFNDLVRSAESMITTSITEGFGFAFLEPWTAGQLLAGRKLPDICRDFENNGLCLDHLYDCLRVPLDAFEENRFFDKWAACIQKNAKQYGVRMDKRTIRTAYQNMTKNRTIDFGILDESFQQQVISRIRSDKKTYEKILRDNPALMNLTGIPDRDERISKNRTAVISNYNRSAYQKKLLEIYQNVIQTDVLQRIDKTQLALEFLRPETFSLLKWSGDALY